MTLFWIEVTLWKWFLSPCTFNGQLFYRFWWDTILLYCSICNEIHSIEHCDSTYCTMHILYHAHNSPINHRKTHTYKAKTKSLAAVKLAKLTQWNTGVLYLCTSQEPRAIWKIKLGEVTTVTCRWSCIFFRVDNMGIQRPTWILHT